MEEKPRRFRGFRGVKGLSLLLGWIPFGATLFFLVEGFHVCLGVAADTTTVSEGLQAVRLKGFERIWGHLAISQTKTLPSPNLNPTFRKLRGAAPVAF